MACISPRAIPPSLLPDGTSKKDKIEAIGLLKAFSFVSEQVNDCSLSLHRLVHLSTRNWLRRQQRFGAQIQKTAEHLNRVFPDNNHKSQKVWRAYLPHALSLLGEKQFQKERRKYIRLIQNIGRCLRTDGRYREAADSLEAILKLQKQGGDDQPSTLTSMDNLALTYWYQGRWKEAEELGMQVMEIRTQVLGSEHPDTLTSMVNLASTSGIRDDGRTQKSWKYQGWRSAGEF
jgi:tetratricopeptide (TPR) repeat protein